MYEARAWNTFCQAAFAVFDARRQIRVEQCPTFSQIWTETQSVVARASSFRISHIKTPP
jgi:hypothetical protein